SKSASKSNSRARISKKSSAVFKLKPPIAISKDFSKREWRFSRFYVLQASPGALRRNSNQQNLFADCLGLLLA
ncbi:MAG: hypothetical protein ACI38O_07415, partial [Fibrobacter intestinalis]|uniref:hypothetical protein n=1 Tax=Fibrobacter intestinalis TaxID=28122 RepID=UPI003F0609D2